ncbi:MAG: pilus assembly protein PilM [Planctomycetes bacterium]|nr:pilus assembly protein PilM [Planctomycetota bacterium]
MISVGLEMGNNAIKLAVLEGGRGAFKLRGFEVHRSDAKKGEAEDDIVSVVDAALKRLKVPRNQVVASIRAQDCAIREITVPFTDEDKIRKTVKYQAENYFTSMSIDDLIIEYSKFAEVDQKSKLMVAGIKKAHIERRLEFLQECGIDPVSIDLDVAALYNTLAHVGTFEGKGAVLIVDIEADTLRIGVVDGGKLRLARAVRMQLGSMRLEKAGGRAPAGGGGDPDDSGVFDTAADESARLPVVILDEGEDEAFSLEDSGISEVERQGIIHRVFMEIDRTVASVNLSSEVEQLCLSGASCALDGIEALFSEHFELPAVRVDLSDHFGGGPDKKSKQEASLSLQAGTALGLALKGLGVDHAGMDFRQEEFAFSGMFARVKRSLACTLTLSFALVFLYAFSLKQDLGEKKNGLAGVKSLQRNLYTVLFPSLDDPTTDHLPLRTGSADDGRFYESLKSEQVRLQQKFGGGAGDQGAARYSALEILRQFSICKSQVSGDWGIQLLKSRIDPRDTGRSYFDCVSDAQGAAIELARRFENNPVVSAKVQTSQLDPKTGKWLFQLQVELRVEEGQRRG